MPEKKTNNSMQYGDYFSAIRSFFEKNRFKAICSAVSQSIKNEIKSNDIKEIRIYLKKHGEFYHPARIAVTTANRLEIPFVLNVALSEAGKGCIQREFKLLKKLDCDFSYSFIPRVYATGEADIQNQGKISMFLGEWFEGYNEFHLSGQTSNKKKIIVWNHATGNFHLTEDQAMKLYQQAAMILTYYYNVETYKQIFPWHHAAGDFILKLENNTIKAKLITVRQYAAMFEPHKNSADSLLDALMFFFINLSIRMRLDRFNGIGDIAWSDDFAVYGAVKGLFAGLALKPPTRLIQDSLVNSFQKYLLSHTESELYDISLSIVNAYNPKAPELPVIHEHLKKHASELKQAIIHTKLQPDFSEGIINTTI